MQSSTDSLPDAETIRAAMTRAGITQGDLARETGLNGSTVSRICRGTYGADGDAIEQVIGAIDRALSARGLPLIRAEAVVAVPAATVHRLKAAPAGGSAPIVAPGLAVAAAVRDPEAPPGLMVPWGGAYATDGQRVMWAVLNAVRQDGEFGLLVSLSGTGKSYVIDRFSEAHPGVLVYRPLRGISQSGVLEDLCRMFGLAYSGSNDTRRRRLLEGCAGRCLIVDEADLLVAGRYATHAVDRLEIYRQLQERGCAVALVGLPALLQTVVRGGETYVFSRIGYARQASPPTDSELAVYWRAQIAGYPQAHAKAGLVALSAARHGYLRYCDKLARRTRETAGDVAAAETLLFRGEHA